MAKKTSLKTLLVMAVIFLGFGCTIAAGGVICVDGDASPGGDGTTWGTAYKYLQDALAVAGDGNDIWVAAGTYYPDANKAVPDGSNNREASFQLINGVAIYGGFPSGGGDWNSRDPNAYETILSGDIGTEGVSGDNSYHVVTGSGTEPSAILDGFTITAGNANGSSPYDRGGGMYNSSGSPTVTNCTFSGNSAEDGGGMSNYDSSNPTLTNCNFSGNSAVAGGGMYDSQSSPTVTNCTFSGNSAGAGGGMYTVFLSSPTVTNCTFSRNSATGASGGMYITDYSSPTVTNCTFTGNSAGTDGGGITSSKRSSPKVTNCILWGDTAASDGNEMALFYMTDTTTIDVNYCDVNGGQADVYVESGCTLNWDVVSNIDADPLFFDANNPDPNLRDYHLLPGSPCIDAGDNNSVPADTADLDNDGNTLEPIPFDIDTDPRFDDGDSNGSDIVDMGSDEVIWDGATGISPDANVMLNPGGGPNDPNIEALVLFDNNSVGDANVTVVEMSSTAHPEVQGFKALGKTLRIDTSLADGEFFMTVSFPFDDDDLAGRDPCEVSLMYWDGQKFKHAVEGNTKLAQRDRWAKYSKKYSPPDSAPTLADLKALGIGANGFFWNTVTQQGFVWANVDHTTDFEGLIHNIADFEPDGDVDFVDFAWFALNWQDTACGVCNGADLAGDGNDVDWADVREFSKNWLFGK